MTTTTSVDPHAAPLSRATARYRWWWRRLAPVAAAATLLAACSSGDGETNDSSPDSSDAEATSEPIAQSPFEEILGSLEGDPTGRGISDEQLKQLRRYEEIVADCMAEQGFSYVPIDPAEAWTEWTDPYGGLSDLEFAETYGYGVAASFEEAESAENDDVFVDPNWEAYEAMTESEQRAWEVALSGESADDDGASPEPAATDAANRGCSGIADAEVYGKSDEVDVWTQIYENPEFVDLFEQMERVRTDVWESPEILELDQAWASCIADAGYPGFENPTDAVNSIYSELEATWEVDEYGEFTPPSAQQLEDLREMEIPLATADRTCQQDLNYDDTQVELRNAAEQAFIDDNRASFDALSAALAQAGE